MERIRKIGCLVFSLILAALMLPRNLAFADYSANVVVAATLDSTVYEVKSISDIAKEFQINRKAAEKDLKKLHVAIVGEIKEVLEEKRLLRLSNGESNLTFEINCKETYDNFKDLSIGDSIWIIGEVTKAKNETIVVKAKLIDRADSTWKDTRVGMADAKGTLYPDQELVNASLPGISFVTPKKWNTVEPEQLRDYQLREKIEKALCYDISDGETVTIYSADWKKIKRATVEDSNSAGDNLHTFEERARDYVSKQLVLGIVHPENIGDKKTNTLDFKYYIGSAKKDDAINGEAFFVKLGERFIVVYYRHDDNAKHAQEVAFFLGGIKQT